MKEPWPLWLIAIASVGMVTLAATHRPWAAVVTMVLMFCVCILLNYETPINDWGHRQRARFRRKPAEPAKTKPEPVIHWSPPPENFPMCGASQHEKWTIDLRYATCAGCQMVGWPLLTKYEASTR